METRDLDYLLAVSAHGSVGQAAEMLGITQPALTKAIQRIEMQLGMPLFERTSRGMKPLQAGHAFIARARRIQLEYEDALKEMQGIRTGEQGILRLGYSPSVPNSLLVGACRQLLRERPVARLRMRQKMARDLLDSLLAGDLDLILAPIPRKLPENLSAHELFSDRIWIVADEEHPLHRLPELSLAALAGQEWVLPAPHILLRQQIDSAFLAQGLPAPTVRVDLDFSRVSVFQLIKGTNMLGLISMDLGDKAKGLRPLHVAAHELDLRRRIGVMHRSGAYLSPLAHRLMELFREQVA